MRVVRKLPNNLYCFALILGTRFRPGKPKVLNVSREKDVWQITLENTNGQIEKVYFQSLKRADRFISGRGKSFNNQLDKYGFRTESIKYPAAVIDVGANIGEFLLNFEAINDLRLIAFEPDDSAMHCLERNDFFGQIAKYPLVASDSNGFVDFYLSTQDADSSTFEPEVWTTKVRKSRIRLDDWILENLSTDFNIYLKIDAEGAEPEVLHGLKRINRSSLRFVAIDVGPERNGMRTEQMCRELLQDLEFDNVSLISENILVAIKI
jgi:FkbM family methyltransferase